MKCRIASLELLSTDMNMAWRIVRLLLAVCVNTKDAGALSLHEVKAEIAHDLLPASSRPSIYDLQDFAVVLPPNSSAPKNNLPLVPRTVWRNFWADRIINLRVP
jgi:hypothetical protein